MRNLKNKFLKEVDIDISDARARIKELHTMYETIPSQINDIEKHIENLQKLKKSVKETNVEFTVCDIEYVSNNYYDSSDDDEGDL